MLVKSCETKSNINLDEEKALRNGGAEVIKLKNSSRTHFLYFNNVLSLLQIATLSTEQQNFICCMSDHLVNLNYFHLIEFIQLFVQKVLTEYFVSSDFKQNTQCDKLENNGRRVQVGWSSSSLTRNHQLMRIGQSHCK